MEEENRITTEVTGNNTDFSMNFVPRMDRDELIKGYHSVLQNTYSVKPYYNRIRLCLRNLGQTNRKLIRIDRYYLHAFIKSILTMGIGKAGRSEFWKLLIWSIWHRPHLFPYAIVFIICGYHFRKLYGISES